ncbi:hypothetical protein CCH79_00015977 [Gambusia affinis]|uniref:Ig-like domain-containing protein n=1 Tax=Gambusia affinis TaxID=33528 RepID=A0A315VRM3_GAMAF|nr:hypothetical protein CCH79_00015977 [Gambusia affinis]
MVYAEVKVSMAENSSTQTAESPESLYAQFILDNQSSEFQILNILKILGIVLLCSSIIIFESWFRFSKKPKKMKVSQTLTENMLTVNMLLSVFLLPGGLADYCGEVTPALRITTPNNIEALSGSCLQIPCTYDPKHNEYDSSKTIYGVWMKGGVNFGSNSSIVIFNSSGPVNTYSLNITGNLKEKNCTTLFPNLTTSHTDKYFFRVENGEYKASACADPLHITVRDYPQSPSINVPSDLKEHQSVTVTCSAFTPCPHSPPELTWNLQQDSLRQTEKNTNGTFTTKIQENITLSDTHDGYNISCSARYPVIGGNKTAETEVTLNAPRNTSASISPSGLVSAGSRVELSCSSRAKPPPRFTWFWNGTKVSEKQNYSFIVTKEGEFYCVAKNDLGNETSSRICVSIKDPHVWKVHSQVDQYSWLPLQHENRKEHSKEIRENEY